MATLQALRPDRDSAVDGFVAAAVRVAADRDRELRSAAQQEVRDTAIAAIADAGASEGVASGQLVKALSYSGFGEVDLSGAMAWSSSGAVLTVIEGRPAVSPSTDDAAAAVQRAATERLEAEQRAAARAERIVGAEAALAEAERSLAAAETAMTEARRRVKAAARARDAATSELNAARRG